MALKKRNKVNASFSMSSMTDLVFLLLIFFMITSTVVTPSAIKILLPQSNNQTVAKPITRVIIDENLNYYIATGREKERAVDFSEIEPYLQSIVLDEPDMYIALHADESVPHREIVRVLNIANENKFKLVIATRPVKK
ncbi:MAG: biopolymer transporter ExbD [Paludibacteraceae bacterium]|jgi:biopolymer transport protein ExbD|nr:biopolymer transporter ExbD [Paludibacteraceae bacterium]NLK92016.1 biopolymer transporter ExbD [Bacteroidales bacterium]MBP6436428.1 biopolymer transporter ExbD [Paludibacteraceae bacterium]MBP7219045.1 biopolymer transporter ExbD [Paludibacteraceae bacterium]MBP8627572.1 biopolymer transporter ExbD [Paludibacteraceae bacterium]